MGILTFCIVLLLHQSSSMAHPSIQHAPKQIRNREVAQHNLKDKDIGKQIIGSSVRSSVSVILNGKEPPQFTDAIGQPVSKQQMPLQVASPINLLNPDRYEFYTFDDNGHLVKRLMTIKEIQSIVANGDGEGATVLHNSQIDDANPEKNVQDIVASVQNVLHKQVEENRNSTEQQQQQQHIMLDTPDVSSSWSMILPAIFGNTGGDIFPQNRPQQVVMTPDSDVVEPTKPAKRKPKPTKRKTTATTTTASSSSSANTQSMVESSTHKMTIVNNQEVIKPLFNRPKPKPESDSLTQESTSVTPKTTAHPTLNTTKRRNKPKPTKAQGTEQGSSVQSTTKKATTKRKPTTARTPTTSTAAINEHITTIPTTKKAQSTKRRHTTRTTSSTIAEAAATTSSATKQNKHRTSTTRLPSSSSSTTGSTKHSSSPTKPSKKKTTTASHQSTPLTSTTKPTHSSSTTVSFTTSQTTHKRKPTTVRKKVSSTTTHPVAYSAASTTLKEKVTTRTPTTTSDAAPTKRIKNKTKPTRTSSTVFASTSTAPVSSSIKPIHNSPTQALPSTTSLPAEEVKLAAPHKVSSLLMTPSTKPQQTEADQPMSSSTSAITYDMISGQDAATTLSLNAIMNSLTQTQSDIETQMSFDKIMDSLKDDPEHNASQTTNSYPTPATKQPTTKVPSTLKPKIQATTVDAEMQTTISPEITDNEESLEATTVMPASQLNDKENIQNGENIVRIEPLFAELLDPILTDLTTTESPEAFTTASSSDESEETTISDGSDSTESTIIDSDLTRISSENNISEQSSGSSEFAQRIDEFINENLDTAETGVPVKQFHNKLSPPQSISFDVGSGMSQFIKEAATVASILEDNTRETATEASSSELRDSDEINTLLTDVLSQMTNSQSMGENAYATPAHKPTVNLTNPVYYAANQLNSQSKLKPINQIRPEMNTPTTLSAMLMPVPPVQELTPQVDANDRFHQMQTMSLQLNEMSNASRENVDEEYSDEEINTSNTDTSTSVENSTQYADDGNESVTAMNVTGMNVATMEVSNESGDSSLSLENSSEKQTVEHIAAAQPEIMLSTPVTTKDDTVLITTLMASMAAGSQMATTTTSSLSSSSSSATPSTDKLTTQHDATDNQNDAQHFNNDSKLMAKETTASTTAESSPNRNDELSLANRHTDNTDRTTMQQSQDSIVQLLQRTTELPSLQMTTILYEDENNDAAAAAEHETNTESDTEQQKENLNADTNMNGNTSDEDMFTEAVNTMRPSSSTHSHVTMTNPSNSDEASDESVEQLSEMSTIRITSEADLLNELATDADVSDNDDESVSSDDSEDVSDESYKDAAISTTIESDTERSTEINDLIRNTMMQAAIASSATEKLSVERNTTAFEESYVKLGESTEESIEDSDEIAAPTTQHQQLANEETEKLATSTATVQSTTKRTPSTMKPMHYFKQPTTSTTTTEQKPATFSGNSQRPIVRPAALSNLKVSQVSQVTRPPVKLDPTPELSLGLEASVMDLQEDIQEFARLCNELAFNYWRSITSEKISSARSLVISPFALTSMLSMVFLGARGSTSGEMNEILRLDDMVTFNPHLVFKNITESVERAKDSGIASSAFVRELFSDRSNGKILQFFKDKVHQFYSGHVEEVNFNVVNDIIRRRTNLLIKRHANGKVMEYLRTNSVWVNGPLSTVSANLFQTDCSKASTIDRDGEMFFQVNQSVRQRRLVPIPAVVYRNGFTAGYDTELDATAVAFGSVDETVSTIYVMPGQHGLAMPGDNLERLEKTLMTNGITKNAWSHLLTSLMERPGLEIQLPRFSHRSFVNASQGLQKLGLKALFNSEEADLRGLTGSSQKDVHLADMIQINTFSTCGEDKISDRHHVEMYPAPPLRKRNSDLAEFDTDEQAALAEMHVDFGSIVQDPIGRSLYDDLLDPKYLEVPLPLRPRQARIPDSPRLRLDKPFIYFVRHNPTGMILFMGRFNPRLLP